MKLLLFFVGITSVLATNGQQNHICDEVDQLGVVTPRCCEGWTDYDNGCLTPVCGEECLRNGGTCVSSDNCRCPQGKVGRNCSRYMCEEESRNHEMLSYVEQRRTFKPSCLPDGSYTILQCDRTVGNCFCVDRWTGMQFVHTITRGVPDCKKYYVESEEKPLFRPKEVIPIRLNGQENEVTVPEETEEEEAAMPPCALKHKKWKESTLLSLFRSEPQCAEDGYFVSHRCDFIFGYCVCIDRNTGDDIQSTKVFSVNIDCTRAAMPEPTSIAPNVFPEEGCVVGNTYHSPGQRFLRGCNMCACHGYNVIQCTDRTCEENACYIGETGKVFEHFMNGECHRCTCENGVTECNVVDCYGLENVRGVENLPTCGNRPSKSAFHNECNTCWCNGVTAMCTLMGCLDLPGTCWVDGTTLSDGQELTKGCDTMRCVGGQVETVASCADNLDSEMRFTGRNPEEGCNYDGKKFFNGESMVYGFKICKCRNFDWDCQPMIHDSMQ